MKFILALIVGIILFSFNIDLSISQGFFLLLSKITGDAATINDTLFIFNELLKPVDERNISGTIPRILNLAIAAFVWSLSLRIGTNNPDFNKYAPWWARLIFALLLNAFFTFIVFTIYFEMTGMVDIIEDSYNKTLNP
jgi:hypothetical protein